MEKAGNSNTEGREIVITRILNAPRELAFEVWTDPLHIAKWYGPDGFTITTQKMKVKTGSEWIFTMHGPDGVDYPNRITYTDVKKPALLAYTHDSGADNDPNGFSAIVTFDDEQGKTKLTMRAIFSSVAACEIAVKQYHAVEGGNQTAGRFEQQLAEIASGNVLLTGSTMSVTRILNAPRELVYKVWTEPEHIAQWWGPDGFTNTIHKMDVTQGGEWNLTMHGPDGTDYRNESVYDEVIPMEKIVYLHLTGPKFRATATLTALGSNKTILDWRMEFETKDMLDKTVETFGAREGMKQNVEKISNYLDSVKTQTI